MVTLSEELSTESGKFIRFEIENGVFKIIRGQGGSVTSVDRLNVQSAVKLADKLYELIGRYEDATDTKVVEKERVKPDYEAMSEDERNRLINELLGYQPDSKRYLIMKEALNTDTYTSGQSSSKIKEEVLQLIYEERSFDWFTSRDFKDWYQGEFDDGHYSKYLSRLSDTDYLKKERIPDDERDNYYRVRYRFQLTDEAEKVIQRYGGFTSDDFAPYRKKSIQYLES